MTEEFGTSGAGGPTDSDGSASSNLPGCEHHAFGPDPGCDDCETEADRAWVCHLTPFSAVICSLGTEGCEVYHFDELQGSGSKVENGDGDLKASESDEGEG